LSEFGPDSGGKEGGREGGGENLFVLRIADFQWVKVPGGREEGREGLREGGREGGRKGGRMERKE